MGKRNLAKKCHLINFNRQFLGVPSVAQLNLVGPVEQNYMGAPKRQVAPEANRLDPNSTIVVPTGPLK